VDYQNDLSAVGASGRLKSLRRRNDFSNTFNAESGVQPFSQKYFAFVLTEIMILSRPSRLDRRGGRVVTDVELGMRLDAAVSLDGRERCGRRNRVVLASRC